MKYLNEGMGPFLDSKLCLFYDWPSVVEDIYLVAERCIICVDYNGFFRAYLTYAPTKLVLLQLMIMIIIN